MEFGGMDEATKKIRNADKALVEEFMNQRHDAPAVSLAETHQQVRKVAGQLNRS